MLPRITVRLQGVFKSGSAPKLYIKINKKQTQIVDQVKGPDSEPDDEAGSSDSVLKPNSYNDEEEDDDSEFDQLLDDTETDDEFGPNFMFDDEVEKKAKDPNYIFCPAAHRKQLLHLFSRHFCQHPLLPERLEDSGWSKEKIRRTAVMEMYEFCFTRGLREVWGYMWTSWYCPKMWKLWARSSSPNQLSRIRTTLNVENFWKQLKHENLHHLLNPRIDHLVWILIHEVLPAYFHRVTHLEATSRLGRSRALTPFQIAFKANWKKLSQKAILSSQQYKTSVESWTCNCGQQKYDPHCLCKHLVQAVGSPSLRFFQQVHRRRVIPFYQHPELIPNGSKQLSFMDPGDGSITDGDDQDYLGDVTQLAGGGWRDLISSNSLGKRSRSTASHSSDLVDQGEPMEVDIGPSSPIEVNSVDYGSEDEKEVYF